MNKTTKAIVLIILVSFYFVALNLITLINFSDISNSLPPLTSSSPTDERAALGDSVVITTFSDGLLWNVKSFHYPTYTNSKAYIFGFIPLPLKIHNFNFLYLHLVFGVVALIFALIPERRYYE